MIKLANVSYSLFRCASICSKPTSTLCLFDDGKANAMLFCDCLRLGCPAILRVVNMCGLQKRGSVSWVFCPLRVSVPVLQTSDARQPPPKSSVSAHFYRCIKHYLLLLKESNHISQSSGERLRTLLLRTSSVIQDFVTMRFVPSFIYSG